MFATTLDGMKFNEKVRKTRELRGIPQHGLAKILGTWQSKVSSLESEPDGHSERKVEPSLLVKLADALNVPLRFLCDPDIDFMEQLEPDPVGPSVTDKERELLSIIRAIGYERSLARLVQAEGPAAQTAAPAPTVKHLGTDVLRRKPKASGPTPKGKPAKKKKPETPR